MALKAYEAEATIAEISAIMTQDKKRMTQAVQAINVARNELDSMAGKYGGFISELDAVATANPDNAAWQNLKDLKDLFVEEFDELKTYAVSLDVAVKGVTKP